MQVMKFGGTSVANAVNMSKVVDIVSKAVERDLYHLPSADVLIPSSRSVFALLSVTRAIRRLSTTFRRSITILSANSFRLRSMRNRARYATHFLTRSEASPREYASSESCHLPALTRSKVSESSGLPRFWLPSWHPSESPPSGLIHAASSGPSLRTERMSLICRRPISG